MIICSGRFDSEICDLKKPILVYIVELVHRFSLICFRILVFCVVIALVIIYESNRGL